MKELRFTDLRQVYLLLNYCKIEERFDSLVVFRKRNAVPCSCRGFTQNNKHAYHISTHIHAHTDVVLIMSDICYFFIIVFYFLFSNHSIPGWATIRDSRPELLVWPTACLTDWVLVCLIVAYIVLMLVLGLSDQQNEWS